MKTLRIASCCPKPFINPYYGLYYGALARFGVEVEHVKDITRTPIVDTSGPRFDVVHFHWGLERIWRTFAAPATLKHLGPNAAAQLYGLAWWSWFLRRVRRAGVKVLWTAHELSPPEGGTWIDELGYRQCAQAADLSVCHSEVCRRQVIQRFGVAPAKTIAIPHGTYDGVLVPSRSRAETRARFALPPHRRLLLCFGYQRPRKGLEVALDAMRSLTTDCHLVVHASTASPNLRRWLTTVQDHYRATPNITFLREELDDVEMANLLSAVDCAVLPYLDVVGSGALAACLTLGRPVVASDLPYFREALAPEPDAGVFFRPGDPSGLAAAVTAFFALDLAKREAAANRLARVLRWDDLVTPVGEWLQAHCAERAARESALPAGPVTT